jgi:hypothetical protein
MEGKVGVIFFICEQNHHSITLKNETSLAHLNNLLCPSSVLVPRFCGIYLEYLVEQDIPWNGFL